MDRQGLGSSKSVHAKGKLISVSLRWGVGKGRAAGQLSRQAWDSTAGRVGSYRVAMGGPWARGPAHYAEGVIGVSNSTPSPGNKNPDFVLY